MNVIATIIVMMPFALAAISLVIAILQFLEKGFPIHTAYIFSSQIVRDAMDKKPYFRQSAYAFLLVAGVFLMMGLDMIKNNGILLLLELIFIIATIVYLVICSRKNK